MGYSVTFQYPYIMYGDQINIYSSLILFYGWSPWVPVSCFLIKHVLDYCDLVTQLYCMTRGTHSWCNSDWHQISKMFSRIVLKIEFVWKAKRQRTEREYVCMCVREADRAGKRGRQHFHAHNKQSLSGVDWNWQQGIQYQSPIWVVWMELLMPLPTSSGIPSSLSHYAKCHSTTFWKYSEIPPASTGCGHSPLGALHHCVVSCSTLTPHSPHMTVTSSLIPHQPITSTFVYGLTWQYSINFWYVGTKSVSAWDVGTDKPSVPCCSVSPAGPCNPDRTGQQITEGQVWGNKPRPWASRWRPNWHLPVSTRFLLSSSHSICGNGTSIWYEGDRPTKVTLFFSQV